MNKIYNNLNIDNLMKSEWFNQFNKEQQKEIRYGLEDNLDVSIYAKVEFNKYQMFYIREGLRENLDVSKYAKPEYTWQEMKVIRDELFNNRKIAKKTKRKLKK